jgi:HAMP domain-containing protein
MASGLQSNELCGLQAENRHLREMIGALRDEMERMRIGEQERLQKTLAPANDEIGQLKAMVVALRDELDRRKIEADERCRALEQAARDEAKQLHEMIRALRDELEKHAEGPS